MLTKKQNQTLAFNDGSMNILKAIDGVIIENLFSNIHYHIDTLGYGVFFKAYDSGVEISKTISIPYISFIHQNDLVECIDFRTNESEIFKIVKITKKDTAPMSWQLTLSKGDIEYDDNRNS